MLTTITISGDTPCQCEIAFKNVVKHLDSDMKFEDYSYGDNNPNGPFYIWDFNLALTTSEVQEISMLASECSNIKVERG
jgi:hypothetical protein